MLFHIEKCSDECFLNLVIKNQSVSSSIPLLDLKFNMINIKFNTDNIIVINTANILFISGPPARGLRPYQDVHPTD